MTMTIAITYPLYQLKSQSFLGEKNPKVPMIQHKSWKTDSKEIVIPDIFANFQVKIKMFTMDMIRVVIKMQQKNSSQVLKGASNSLSQFKTIIMATIKGRLIRLKQYWDSSWGL